jgi:adenylate cyclase
MSEGTQRKLAAIVSADVVGFSRLMGVDESGTLAAMQAHRRKLWDPVTNQFNGRIVGTAGDGQLIEFASAVAAVECSITIQRGMLERNSELPQDRQMLLRIGVNMGEVIVAGDELYGDGVNIAARLQELSEPGGIAIADIVHGQVHDKLDVTFTDDGEHEAKNIARPIHVWRWAHEDAPTMAGAPTSTEVPALPDKPSIAVLPFENMSGDPEQEYFADGMAEDIITALSRIDMLFVIARNSSFTYKGRAVDIRQVARELGVRYVLEGSVRRAGDRVRITGQLLEAESGSHLWADKFDGALEDIFELQDQIAESVVGILEPTLRTAEIERSRRKRPENLDAYDLYLQATPMVFSFRADENQRAIDLLDRAIELDPNMAASLAFKAWCMTQRIAAGWNVLTPEFQTEAVALAQAAIAADDQHAIALATAGFTLAAMGKDYRAGVAAVRRALDLNNNSAYVCMHAGYVLYFDNPPEEAIPLIERAMRLSPIDPLNYHFLQGIAAAQLIARRPQQAYEYGLRSVAENGNWNVSKRFLASACGHLGRIDEGKRYLSLIDTKKTISAVRLWTPYRSEETLNYFLDGLRKVGLAEE